MGNSCGTYKILKIQPTEYSAHGLRLCIHYGIKFKSLRSIAMRKGKAGEGANRK